MGNKNLSTKYVILKILREANAPVSGEEAAKLADISRVSVWKAIQSLQASGYGISSTRAGYFLEKDLKDSLFPWEFGAEEELFFHFPETESTMTEARKIAQENSFSKKMEIITADKQTTGTLKPQMDNNKRQPRLHVDYKKRNRSVLFTPRNNGGSNCNRKNFN